MGIAEEKDTEGAVAKEVENQTNEPIIFHLCFVKFFLTTDVLCQVVPPLILCRAPSLAVFMVPGALKCS
jgi:hypothetical protein